MWILTKFHVWRKTSVKVGGFTWERPLRWEWTGRLLPVKPRRILRVALVEAFKWSVLRIVWVEPSGWFQHHFAVKALFDMGEVG